MTLFTTQMLEHIELRDHTKAGAVNCPYLGIKMLLTFKMLNIFSRILPFLLKRQAEVRRSDATKPQLLFLRPVAFS